MDFSQIVLNQSLTFIAWATFLIFLVIAGFFVKLLMDLSTLTQNVNKTSVMLNEELKPTLDELNSTLVSLNMIIKNTDDRMGNIKGAVDRVVGTTKNVTGTLFSGLVKGFGTAWKIFAKK